MNKFKEVAWLIGEFILVMICCYLIAVIFTIFAVALGGVSVDDQSEWSNHIRSVATILLK